MARSARPFQAGATGGILPAVKHELRAEQRRPFSQSCLPLTVELARGLKDEILGELGSVTASWNFEDRLLAWLNPSLEPNVRAYYSGDGAALDSMFDAHQCQRLDQLLLGVLVQRLDAKYPGLASALGHAAERPDGAGPGAATGSKKRE